MKSLDSRLVNAFINNSLKKDLLDNVAKRYSANDELKRKPVFLNTGLYDKIKSLGAILKEIYYAIEHDANKLYEISCFDELRAHQYQTMITKAKQINEPAERSKNLAEIFGMIKQDIITSLGLDDANDKNVTKEEMLRLAFIYGQQYFE